MLIAVSGTHCIGKTAFINEFLRIHAEYKGIEEPYYQMLGEAGFESDFDLSLEGFVDQLDYSIEKLSENTVGSYLIFDRCPVDFIAYAMYHADNEGVNINDHIISERFALVEELLKHLDLIIFMPISDESPIIYTEDDSDYRLSVDENFKRLFRDDVFQLFSKHNHPRIIELLGDTRGKIAKIESYL